MVTLKLSGDDSRNITSGRVLLPRTGIWIANLRVNATDDLPDRVVLDLGVTEMPATISKSELIGGTTEVRLVGGAGGLGEAPRPKHYHRPLVKHVLADLLRDAGETLSPTSTASVLATELEAWTTVARTGVRSTPVPTGSILAALCAVAGSGVNWRVLGDGSVWIGTETWPDAAVDVRSIDNDGPNAAALVGTDIPGLWPGTLLGGRKVDYVCHDLDANRTTVLFAEGL